MNRLFHIPTFRLLPAALAVALTAGLAGFGQEPVVIDETIARVNRDLITRSMYDAALNQLKAELDSVHKDDETKKAADFEKLRKMVVGMLIDDKLVSQRADEIGINVEADINQAILRICGENGYKSLTDCQAAMEKQNIGMEDLKANFRKRLQRQALLSQEVYGPTYEKITDTERRTYYEAHKTEFGVPGEVELSEIFLSFNDDTKAQVEEKAKQALDEARKGADFKALVKKYGDDTRSSKLKDGKLPTFKETDLAEQLKQELDKIQPGQCTPILRSDKGCQIIRLDARTPARIKPYDELINDITYRIALAKSGDKIKTYFKNLRTKALIQIAPAYEALYDADAVTENQ